MDIDKLLQLCFKNNLKISYLNIPPNKMEYSTEHLSIISCNKHTNQSLLNIPIEKNDDNTQFYYVKGTMRHIKSFLEIINKFNHFMDLIEESFAKQITYVGIDEFNRKIFKFDENTNNEPYMDFIFDTNFNIICSVFSWYCCTERYVFISTLLTNPSYHRRGFGYILINNLTSSYLHQYNNIKRFNASIMVWNYPSLSLFKKLGYQLSNVCRADVKSIEKGMIYHNKQKLNMIQIPVNNKKKENIKKGNETNFIELDEAHYYVVDFYVNPQK